MGASEEILDQALQYHRAGDLDRAEQGYRQILKADPSHYNAWFYLGEVNLLRARYPDAVAAYQHALQLSPDNAAALNSLGISFAQQGKWDDAIKYFREATQKLENNTEALNNLGIALSNRGKLSESESCYREALRVRPDYPEALSNMGLVLGSLGKVQEAIASYQKALELRPDMKAASDNLQRSILAQNQLYQEWTAYRMNNWYLSDEAVGWNEFGLKLKGQGRLADAIQSFQEALRVNPQMTEALNNVAVTFQERGNTAEALEALGRALALKPDFVDARNNLGTVLETVGKLDEATECYREALRLRPDFSEAHNNLGVVIHKLGKYEEALAEYQKAVELKADYGEAHHNVGNALLDLGRLDDALDSYNRALEFRPDYPDARLGRAQTWLRMGKFDWGWAEFEWRWRRKNFPPRPFHQPVWDGSSLTGRTILLHAEQGLGDTIQFIRYAPLVKEYGGRVVFECQDILVPLLGTCPGVDQIISRDPSLQAVGLPPFDTHAPLVSLPRILHTTPENIPANVPYVSADPKLLEEWRGKIGADPGFKLGLAWQGNPDNSNDRLRSVRLKAFEAVAGLPDLRLFSVQKGAGSEQIADVRDRFTVTDLGSQFRNFQDTAAALKSLDLVITVDSAVAHCAGALAVPVWVLIPFSPDWRWMSDREDSLWYPTLRLFRQPRPGDWDAVFDKLQSALADKLRTSK